MNTEWMDTHAHLDFPEFAEELPDVIRRAREAGVARMIAIGTSLESSARVVELAARFPEVYAAVGVHPCYVEESPDEIREELRRLAGLPKVVAIGEIGLDYYHLPSRDGKGTVADDDRVKAKQRRLFEQQLQVAAEAGLNAVVHQRNSFEDTLECVSGYAGRVRTVFHCFSGTVGEMQRVLEKGSLVSYTGIVTFKNAEALREVVRQTPAGSYMLETDCPYLAPAPYRGKRCEPAYVATTGAAVAAVKGVEPGGVANDAWGAAERFFRWG